jgi:galactonate dehydratase
MKITKIKDLHATSDLGQFSFLKISTDGGLVSWGKFNERSGSKAHSAVSHAIEQQLIGQDPLPVLRIVIRFYHQTVRAPEGLNQRANAPIEIALWNIKGRSVGLPVYSLFGDPVREKMSAYRSHRGSYRMQAADKIGLKSVRMLNAIRELGAEVRARGFKGFNTNCFHLIDGQLRRQMQGYGNQPTRAALNLERHTLTGVVETLRVFRDGAAQG